MFHIFWETFFPKKPMATCSMSDYDESLMTTHAPYKQLLRGDLMVSTFCMFLGVDGNGLQNSMAVGF